MSDMYFKSLPDTSTPLIPTNLDKLNDIKVSPTQPTTNEKVWIQKGKNLFKELQNMKEVTGQYKVLAQGNISTVEGETYTISFDTNNNGGEVYVHEAIFKYGTAICDGTRKSITVTAKHTKNFYNHTVLNSISSVDTPYNISNVQIEQGSITTEYEPYVENKIYCKNDNGVFEEFYKNEDTGWVDISSYLNTSIFSVREGYPPMVRKIGNVVYLRGEVYISTKPSEHTNTMFSNLPAQFVPEYQATGAGVTYANFRPYSIWLEHDTIKCDIDNTDAQIHISGFDLCNISPYIVD